MHSNVVLAVTDITKRLCKTWERATKAETFFPRYIPASPKLLTVVAAGQLVPKCLTKRLLRTERPKMAIRSIVPS